MQDGQTVQPSTESSATDGRTQLQRESGDVAYLASGTREFIEEVSSAIDHSHKPTDDSTIEVEFENPGLLIISDSARRVVLAQSDISGLFPAFWTIIDNEIFISDSLRELQSVCKADTDEVGFIEFMRFAYTIGQRTLFRNVKRLRPGEFLQYERDSGKVQLKDLSPLWSVRSELSLRSTVDSVCELLISACKPMKDSALMMSAGWDSRTLLAGALDSSDGQDLRLYYHGDQVSREARIVRSLAAKTGIALYSEEIKPSCLENDFLRRTFLEFDNVVHPYWHAASDLIENYDSTIKSVSAGILGEILGGHYGPPMLLSGRRKIVSTLGYLIGFTRTSGRRERTDTGEEIKQALDFLWESPYSKPWYMDQDVWADRFRATHESVNKDIKQAVMRYFARGVSTREGAVEAFITEHRGSQHIAAQLLSAATKIAAVAPFCSRSLLEFSCQVPYELKANNALNRLAIKRLNPALLSFPMAATVCRASRPILLQELSRAMRKVSEGGMWALHSLTRGKIKEPRLGWANFQFLDESSALLDLVDGLQSPIWDKHRIKPLTDAHTLGNYHPLMDMLLKMKTLDLHGVQ